jgi:hypothetical protein
MFKVIAPLVTSLLLLSGGTYLALERPAWVPYYGRSERVMVFLVGSRSGVERVRKAVDSSRIVASTPDAIALIEGRIVAVDATAVEGPYKQAGWMDRDLEFFHVQKADHLKASRHVGEGVEVDPERLARLRQLVHKPTLSAGEQMFVLQAMNDGVQF